MRHQLLLMFTLLYWHGSAHAEGSCPPGYYPINSPGVNGCAPIPDNDGSIVPSQLTAPEIAWSTRWGAIATDSAKGSVGAVVGQESERKAKREAIVACRTKGGVDCLVSLSYYNQCGAMAWGQSFASFYSAPSKEEASAKAVENCTKNTSDCQIYYADCSFPVRKN